ncbi:response regulator transcription factor [Pseudoteredinibacter isoporae]|uniref:DNA-binding response OmpR family regulator n=1 Tax=Pseudoteredinibacter isoporae TaxID=570281 RepID=A0A7X0MY40_9GAMM|nr:response regulator transcription factor [Pseudoteredinibacter isoporae]MBB6522664.1 DNA-binding response OmpR family regulator [Pseudoteredinibacter isoporae]NHO88195.1 response regulator transcription factor [Pseudoteredinibacter isoporae]NIB23474.1 response regulator transcription factor [Pseudoteredinibacter isoporae]
MTVQTLLVEDNINLATTIATYLKLEGIECDFAPNGEAGLNLALNNSYQTILLDINLPKLNGYEVCDALRSKGVDTPILMLTARDTLADKLSGFNVGTDDYLVKPFEMEELAARIKSLSHRRSAQAKRLFLADLEVDLQSKSVRRAGQEIDVTPTGWIILVELMRNSPDIVKRNTLEWAVWQDDVPDTDLLKVHMYRLRQQIDKPFDKPLIHTVPNHGFVMRELNV